MRSHKIRMTRKFLLFGIVVYMLSFSVSLSAETVKTHKTTEQTLAELRAYANGTSSPGPGSYSTEASSRSYNTRTYDTAPEAAVPETYTWAEKLKRGVADILFFPVDIAREIQITSNEESMLVGWTAGLGKGLGLGVLRLGAGVIELVTFPFNFPKRGKAPLVEPEYVWDKPGVKYA